MTIIAAADGSALGNPGPAGWAWYVNDECWAAGGWPRGTNNQGELMAVIDLFEATAHVPGEDLRVLCDSQYVINAVTKWMPGWKRKGWRKADGSPVLNLDLLKRLDAAIVGRRFTFEWVKGHAGHELNEAADERARGAATAYQNRTSVPTGPGWPGGAVRKPSAAAVVPAPVTPASALELDIFADSDRPAGAPEISGPDTVLALERRLHGSATQADAASVAALLHPEFEEFDSAGRVRDRDAVIRTLTETPEQDATLEPRTVDALGDDTVFLSYRRASSQGASLHSSLWQRVNGTWLLRFHQGSRES
jgi:ribonuclease HI